MSSDDVHPDEMNEPHDFDDASADALLSGTGRDVDPRLADLVGDMRVAYTSVPPAIGAELSALMRAPQPVPARPMLTRRFCHMRSSILAKIGVAAAAVVAATGGLAAANALPAPVQDAVSHIGIAGGSHHDAPFGAEDTTTTVDPTSTTMPVDTSTTMPVDTSTTTEPNRHHRGDGAAAADGDSGCGDATTDAGVASDGRSNNDGQDATANDSTDETCDTTTTTSDTTTTTSVSDSTTTTTADNGHDHEGDHQDSNNQDGNRDDSGNSGAGNQDASGNRDQGSGDHQGGSANGGDSGPSHSGDGGSSSSGQGDTGSGGGN